MMTLPAKQGTAVRSILCALLFAAAIAGFSLRSLGSSLLQIQFQSGSRGMNINLVPRPKNPPLGVGGYLHRVSYRYNQPVSPEDFDPRRRIDTGRWFACSKNIVLVGWWDKPIEPIASFMRAVRNVSGCDIRTIGTLHAAKEGREEEHIIRQLNASVDIVMWWNWRVAVKTMELARNTYSHQVSWWARSQL